MQASDPTAIEIILDPTQERMRGVAIHGNTPFDVPYISKVYDDLWQGGCHPEMTLPSFVNHLVSLYPWGKYQVKHDLDSELTVRMYDSNDGFNTEQVRAIAEWVNTARKSGVVLVHCQAGLNRSGLVTAAALILEGMPASEAIKTLRAARSGAVLCNQSFHKWLFQFEEEVAE